MESSYLRGKQHRKRKFKDLFQRPTGKAEKPRVKTFQELGITNTLNNAKQISLNIFIKGWNERSIISLEYIRPTSNISSSHECLTSRQAGDFLSNIFFEESDNNLSITYGDFYYEGRKIISSKKTGHIAIDKNGKEHPLPVNDNVILWIITDFWNHTTISIGNPRLCILYPYLDRESQTQCILLTKKLGLLPELSKGQMQELIYVIHSPRGDSDTFKDESETSTSMTR